MDKNQIADVGKMVRCDWCDGRGYTNTFLYCKKKL